MCRGILTVAMLLALAPAARAAGGHCTPGPSGPVRSGTQHFALLTCDGYDYAESYGTPSHVKVEQTGSIVYYTPEAGYTGTASFQWIAVGADGRRSAPQTFTIQADPAANRTAWCTAYGSVRLGETRPITVDCSDEDGDTPIPTLGTPSRGTVSGLTQVIPFGTTTPVNEWTFAYTAPDDGDRSSVRIDVTADDGHEPVIRPSSIQVLAKDVNTPTRCSLTRTMYGDDPTDLVPGCSDDESDGGTITVTVPPAHGALASSAVTYAPGGVPFFHYTPVAGYRGEDTFTFVVTDDHGATSEPVVATIDRKDWLIPPAPVATPTPTPTPPAVPDTTAPVVRLTALPQRAKAVRRHGLAIAIACDTACAPEATVAITRGTARRLKVGRAAMVVAHRQWATPQIVSLPLDAAVARAIVKRHRPVTLTVAVTARDAAGNAGRATKQTVLR